MAYGYWAVRAIKYNSRTMIHADRILLDEIIHDNVELLPHDHIEACGFKKIFEEHTVMFCYQGRWHTSHEQAVSLIHLRRATRIQGMDFERIIITKDKSFDNGRIVLPEDYEKYDIPILWGDGYKTQLVFVYRDGIYITSDYNCQYIRYPAKAPYMRRCGSKMSRGVKTVRSD